MQDKPRLTEELEKHPEGVTVSAKDIESYDTTGLYKDPTAPTAEENSEVTQKQRGIIKNAPPRTTTAGQKQEPTRRGAGGHNDYTASD